MKLLSSKPTQGTLIVAGVTLLGVIVTVIVVTYLIGNKYSQSLNIKAEINPVELGKQTFSIRKISITDLDNSSTLEISKNGIGSYLDQYGNLNKKLFSDLSLFPFLSLLTKEQFEALLKNYYSSNKNLRITIETNFGTKTIIINSSGNTPPPDVINQIVNQTGNIITQIVTPTPPPPTTSPSQQPIPTATPSPTPTSLNIPSPSPTASASATEEFNCASLAKQGVTVSNTRCLDN